MIPGYDVDFDDTIMTTLHFITGNVKAQYRMFPVIFNRRLADFNARFEAVTLIM